MQSYVSGLRYSDIIELNGCTFLNGSLLYDD